MEKKYYHLCSNGNDAKDFIIGRSDYIAALNRIGVCAANCKCVIVAFDIEDTHLHVLLYGTFEECERFKKLFHKLSMMHIAKRDDRNDATLNMTLYEITDSEYLLNVSLYVVTQPTKDGKKIMYFDYVWGSGPLYFRGDKVILPWYIDNSGSVRKPTRVGDIPRYKIETILKTRNLTVPKDWLICNGILLPQNYVDVERYESIVRTHNRYRCFAATGKDKDRAILDMMAKERGIELEEDEARRVCESLCKELSGYSNTRMLNVEQRIQLAREMRKRYRIGLSQISRRVHLPEEEIRKYVK